MVRVQDRSWEDIKAMKIPTKIEIQMCVWCSEAYRRRILLLSPSFRYTVWNLSLKNCTANTYDLLSATKCTPPTPGSHYQRFTIHTAHMEIKY